MFQVGALPQWTSLAMGSNDWSVHQSTLQGQKKQKAYKAMTSTSSDYTLRHHHKPCYRGPSGLNSRRQNLAVGMVEVAFPGSYHRTRHTFTVPMSSRNMGLWLQCGRLPCVCIIPIGTLLLRCLDHVSSRVVGSSVCCLDPNIVVDSLTIGAYPINCTSTIT